MPISRNFSKYQGAGNDFILFEDFSNTFPEEKVPSFCHRQLGIGADGLILARRSEVADFQMIYFNADGSKAAMCGNGLRCFVHFLSDLGYVKPLYLIEIERQVLTVKRDGAKISTFLPTPHVLHWEVTLHQDPIYVVDTGVPHAVLFAREGADVLSEGRQLRHHEKFVPDGVNVNFAYVLQDDLIELQTYERGVEAETLSCGSGAAAVAFVAHKLGYSKSTVNVRTQTQECLCIKVGKGLIVEGPSKKVFDGSILT